MAITKKSRVKITVFLTSAVVIETASLLCAAYSSSTLSWVRSGRRSQHRAGRKCFVPLLPFTTKQHVQMSRTSLRSSSSSSSSSNIVDDLFEDASSALETIKTENEIRYEILAEIDSGIRNYPSWVTEDYGESIFDEYATSEDDDPDALDPLALGRWDETDLLDKFEYEWDPTGDDEDPNTPDPQYEHVTDPPVDGEGIEIGYDPIFGRSNPVDTRTIIDQPDSYVIAERTRDERLVTPEFPPRDVEVEYNRNVTKFRKSLKIIETYEDPWLRMEVPKNVAKWHGYPEQMKYPTKDYTNNRFTKPQDKTPFDTFDPHRARKIAVQLARSKNNEWLPPGTSEEYRRKKTEPFRRRNVIVGTLFEGEKDPEIVKQIQPVLDILGSCATLLSIEQDTVFRFHYHGLIKNRVGMAAWTETLIRDCGVECTGVVFETGRRKRDPWYDGGDHWFGPY